MGLPDERFGERVVAVASIYQNTSASPDDVMVFTAEHLAGYKQPRQVLLVDQVRRAPNGKADYKWARSVAEKAFAKNAGGQ